MILKKSLNFDNQNNVTSMKQKRYMLRQVIKAKIITVDVQMQCNAIYFDKTMYQADAIQRWKRTNTFKQ